MDSFLAFIDPSFWLGTAVMDSTAKNTRIARPHKHEAAAVFSRSLARPRRSGRFSYCSSGLSESSFLPSRSARAFSDRAELTFSLDFGVPKRTRFEDGLPLLGGAGLLLLRAAQIDDLGHQPLSRAWARAKDGPRGHALAIGLERLGVRHHAARDQHRHAAAIDRCPRPRISRREGRGPP